jgi:hypothetical protein
MKTFTLILALSFMIVSCDYRSVDGNNKSGPRIHEKIAGDIHYGKDICSFTGDTISVVRYGAVIELKNGSKLKFNSAESMAKYLIQRGQIEYSRLIVVDFADGENLIDVTEAKYLKSKLRQSPGKMHITPINRNNLKMLENVNRAYPGTFLEWSDVLHESKMSLNELKVSKN